LNVISRPASAVTVQVACDWPAPTAHVPFTTPVPVTSTLSRPAAVTLTVTVMVRRANVAVTLRACDSVTTHAPAPVQSPVQPEKVLLASGAAVSVTLAPGANGAVHPAALGVAQVMPAGALVTEPPPAPSSRTASGACTTTSTPVSRPPPRR
jgi:hypothetical protein